MQTPENSYQGKVVKFVQELLLDEKDKGAITPTLISQKIDSVIQMNPKWGDGLDRVAVTDELIRRFSIWVGDVSTLVNSVGHVPWLNSSRKGEWRYWQRYREWLERKLSFAAIEALDEATDKVLGLLEDPLREGAWDRRGLVVGHVQSGKTANYTGLICKAADAGYKIIIVLAGLHNNLRSQTQMRLDEGFLGFESKSVQDGVRVIGVGEIDGDPNIRPNFATNRSNNGDFSTAVARNFGIKPEERPWLFVVKKNKTILSRLYAWIKNHVADTQHPSTGRSMVTNLPLLLIDDEADHASVDTGEQVFDGDGQPDPEHEPTAINQLIRKILHTFGRSAFVGYTATPFANIFIHERGETNDEGPDLFPSSFIVNLGAPSNYVGPARVFGLQRGDGDKAEGLPLVREVDDSVSLDGLAGWMPQKHKSGHTPSYLGKDEIPPSLVEAIDAFILSCAVRRARGESYSHASMLIHVTRFNSVQRIVAMQVERHIKHLRQRITRNIDSQQILDRLHALWKSDFEPTTSKIAEACPEFGDLELQEWPAILELLPDVISDTEVRLINGLAKDALDYGERAGQELNVIAIGGDKLARGLTLEGLSVSYFLRASRMYDTLMQMGRWFGYRPGYLDVCRLYITPELKEWFCHITEAAEELREEFDLMAESGATPKDYGLKVQAHPMLLVTSRLKMRTARDLMLSFSGQIVETVSFLREPASLHNNLEATKKLLVNLGYAAPEIERVRNGKRHKWRGYLWENAPAQHIIDFLLSYRTHPKAYKVNSTLIAEFIQLMSATGELTSWTIALLGGKLSDYPLVNGIRIPLMQRNNESSSEDRYSIGRLLSPRDEAIDMTEDAWRAAFEATRQSWRPDPGRYGRKEPPDEPSGPAIRQVRGFGGPGGVAPAPERGLLLLYLMAPESAGMTGDDPPVVGFGISFPGSNSGHKVSYKVNNVAWEQDYGPAY